DDDSFDVVTGFTSFFFADDMVAALREAARVARRGAPVVIQAFGRPEECGLEAVKLAVAAYRPGGAQGQYWRPGGGAQSAGAAGRRRRDRGGGRAPDRALVRLHVRVHVRERGCAR